jgi:hypothetical protein
MKKAELSKEKLDLFNLIIRNFRTTLKNSVLYNPGHPVFDFSIKNFMISLDKWFLAEEKINLGFSERNILLDGLYVEEKNEIYQEVANYMHMRGVVALSLLKDVDEKELTQFFSFMKNDIKDIRDKGGVSKNIPSTPHLKIKEIDYGALLESVKETGVVAEGDIWQSLSEIVEESKQGKLPESKMEFLADFLKDPERSASVLNKIYKDAVTALKDDEAAEDIRGTIAKLYEYFENNSSENIKETSEDVAGIISKLDPALIMKLFEEAKIDGKEYDLAKEITKNFSNDFMAEFISTLIASEESVNENLLKVFDRLMPGEEKSGNVASMVADRLFEKKLLNADALSQLQVSIKEIFKANPTSSFMSQMYKMTVDTFVGKKTGIPDTARKLSPLVKEYVRSIDIGRLKGEEAAILINIVWNEDDSLEFRKFSEKLLDIIPEVLDLKDAKTIREIFELYLERLRPEQQRNKKIDQEAKNFLKKIIANETISRAISFIPEVDGEGLEDIVYVLKNTKGTSIGLLMDAFVLEKDQSRRDRLSAVLSRMKKDASGEIERRIEYCEPPMARDLFKVLKESDPEKAHMLTESLLGHKNHKMRIAALEAFDPGTEKEKDDIYNIFRKEKNRAIQDKAMAVLLRTQDKKVVEKLFRSTQMNLLKQNPILKLVELCGQLKVRESMPYLKRIFLRRSIFYTKKNDELRVASAVSLRQLGTTEAMELIEKGLNDRSNAVRRMCNIILELEKEEPKKDERDKDAAR